MATAAARKQTRLFQLPTGPKHIPTLHCPHEQVIVVREEGRTIVKCANILCWRQWVPLGMNSQSKGSTP